jgi:photosystem II stability/assembly factor-like uncharacterized protein
MKILIHVIIFLTSIFLVNSQVWLEQFKDKDNVNLNDIVTVANQHFDTVDITARGSGIKQFKRFEWFWKDRVQPDGTFPNIELLTEGLNNNSKSKLSKTQSTNNWSHLGPFGSNGGYSGIGRVNCVRVNPHNGSIWAGTPSGGIWTSSNNGNSWSTNTDKEDVITSLGITSIAFHPTNSNIVYAATGDGDGTNTYSYGVIKTTDGGSSWKSTGLSWNITQYRTISKLLIDKNSPNILYIAGSSGVYKSTNSGDNWDLVKSGTFKDLEFKPNDYSTLYAAGTQIWKTTDSGSNWNQLTNGVPTSDVRRIALAVSKNSSDALYALVGNSSGNNLKGVYLSTNGGTSFTEIADNSPNMMGYSKTGDDTKGQVWYDLCIEADQDDWEKVIIGGVNLWRTTDAGSNWEISSMWSGNHNNLTTVHADQHDLWYDDNNNVIYVGNDGSVYKSDDFGESWDWIGSGILATQFYRFGISQLDTSLYIGGTQDNGTKVKKAAGNWVDKIGGDGFDAVIDHEDKNTMYGCIYYGDYFKSTNGGNSFKRINDLDNDNEYDDINESGAWSTPLILNPKNSETLILGMKNIWISNDGGDNFSKISNFNYGNNKIVRISMSEVDTNIIYVAFNSRLYKTTNYGSDWTQVTRPGNTSISYIFTDDEDADKLWATNSRYSSGNKVFESTDAGATWSNISLNLPNIPVLTIVKQKGTDDRLWIGTDVGVYYKDDNMSEWEEYNSDLPNVIVTELEINSSYNQLYASTYGRGIWKVDIPTSLNSPTFISPNFAAVGVKTTNLIIDWNDIDDADKYIIELSEVEDFSTNLVLDTVNISRYVASNLDNNKKYYARLKSLNLYTQSDWSTIHNFTTVVGRVQLLLPTNNNISVNFDNNFNWKKLDGATGYELLISNVEDFSTIVKNINTTDLSSILNENLTLDLSYNTQYWWKVRANNIGEETPAWSFTRSFETYLDKPNITSPLNNSLDLNTTFTSTWSEVDGADEYELNYYEVNDQDNKFVESTDNTSFLITNLDTYTEYGLYVYAIKEGNKGLVSDTVFFTTRIGSISLIKPENNLINVDENQTFEWSLLNYATEYEIEIDVIDSFDSPNLLKQKSFQASLDTDLQLLDTTYFWRVSAYVNNKKGPYSDIYTIRTKLNPLTLNYPTNNSNGIQLDSLLHWEDRSNSIFNLEISTDSNFNNIVTEERINENLYSLNELDYYKSYFWRVKVLTGNYESDWSNIFKFITEIGIPNLIRPTDEAINQDVNLDLIWENVNYAENYDTQIDTIDSFDSPNLITKNLKNSSEFFTDLEYDKEYFWRVRLNVDNNNSGWSNNYTFRTKLESPILITPSDGSTDISKDGDLEWIDNSNATRYQVQISDNNQFNTVIYDESVSGFKFSYSGLESDKHYFWKVKSTRNNFESDWSDVFSFYTPSTIDRPQLIEPANLTQNMELSEIILKWNELQDIEKYEIEIALDSSFSNIILNDKDIVNNSYEFNLNLKSQVYYWRIRGIRANNVSEWSVSWEFSTTLPKVSLISPPNNKIDQPASGVLTWDAEDKANMYNIEISEDNNFINSIESLITSVQNNELDYKNLELNKKYYWRVNSESDIALSEWSDTWNFTTSETQTSVEFKNSNTTISVIPNPINETAIIAVNSDIYSSMNIRLTDLNGRNVIQLYNSVIRKGENIEIPINTKGISSGAYLLILESENETKSIKVFIN